MTNRIFMINYYYGDTIFIAAGGVWELTHIIMALMPGVSGGFITLTLFIVALMLVFLLSMIITYPAIWLFRYV